MASIFPRDASAYDLEGRLNACGAYDANAKAPAYGYEPHAAPGVTFTLIFAISTLVHLFQTEMGILDLCYWRSRSLDPSKTVLAIG